MTLILVCVFIATFVAFAVVFLFVIFIRILSNEDIGYQEGTGRV